MVGDQPILAGDLLGQINEMLHPYVDRLSEDELQEQRGYLMRQLLPQLIDIKLLSMDVLRPIPVDRREEIERRLSEEFTKTHLDRMVQRANVSSPQELDARLRSFGSSVEHQRRLFIDQMLAMQAKSQNVSRSEEVTHEEMLEYYRQHLADYEYSAQARWERLMVRIDEFRSKAEARQAIAQMGDRVLYGAPLAVVAQRYSQGPDADDGGYHDWTTRGSLVSAVLDDAIFSLPVGQLSRILEDEQGYHIVRVIERRDAGRVSFLEVQRKIREKILAEQSQAKEQEYLARLRRQTRIWTIFDEQEPNPTRTAADPPSVGAGYR
jgi:parvulin-like peptidyl-prolyl isomerase